MTRLLRLNLTCPNCRNQACSLWRKSWGSPSTPIECGVCRVSLYVRPVYFLPALLFMYLLIAIFGSTDRVDVMEAAVIMFGLFFGLAVAEVWAPLTIYKKREH